MMLRCTTGFENYQNGSSKTYLFHVPCTRFPGKELNIGIHAKSATNVRKIGLPNKYVPVPGLRPEMGQFTDTNYEVEDGTILKIFTTRSGGFGSMRVQGSIFIRCRSSGPLMRIGAILTGAERSLINRAWTEGRFDFVPVDEAERFGVPPVPMHFRGSFDESMVRRAFEIIEVEPELQPVQQPQVVVVENSKGEEVQVPRRGRRRALDL